MLETFKFLYNGARVDVRLNDIPPNSAEIKNLHSENLGRGDARNVMELATAFADERGLRLYLVVQAARHKDEAKSLTDKQLEAFYGSLGFVRYLEHGRRPVRMLRNPRQF